MPATPPARPRRGAPASASYTWPALVALLLCVVVPVSLAWQRAEADKLAAEQRLAAADLAMADARSELAQWREQARMAAARQAVAEKRLEELAQLLRVEVVPDRTPALENFRAALEAGLAAGQTTEQVVAGLSDEKVAGLLDEFRRLIGAERATDESLLTVDDWIAMGLLQMRAGDPPAAIAAFTAALKMNPANPVARQRRGMAYLKINQWALALADFDAAVEADPTLTDALFHRGILRRDVVNDLEGAERDLTALLTAQPGRADAQMELGVLHHRNGQPLLAIAAFDRAIELDPTMWAAWNNRGIVTRNTDRAATIRDWQQAWKLCPEAAWRDQIAAALRELGGNVPE